MTATPEAQAGAPADELMSRLNVKWEHIPGAAARKISRILRERREAATALQAMQAERDAAAHEAFIATDNFKVIAEENQALIDANEAAEARALAAEAEADRRVAEEREAIINLIGKLHNAAEPSTAAMSEGLARDLLQRWNATGARVQHFQHAIRARTATVSGEGMGG
jgi:hypothetical protein